MINTTRIVTNITGDRVELRATGQTVAACVALGLIMVISIVGNIGVIMVITLYRQMRNDISNMLIVNLSVTDLANTSLVMLSALINLIADDWILGSTWCDAICAINYCLIIVSMLTLCCISLDRYQAVLHPLTYGSTVKRVTLLLAICYTWVQGAVFGLMPSVLGWVDYDYWEAICAIQWHLYRPGTIIYVVTAFSLCFLGPGVILCYCYVKIIKEVQKQTDQITVCNPDMDRHAKKRLSDKSRIIWSLLVIVFAYFIFTTPFSLTKLIKVSVSDTSTIPGPINLTAALLGYMASAINPLIYGIFRKDFQKAYLQILNMIFLGKRRTSTLDSPYLSQSRKTISYVPDHSANSSDHINNKDTRETSADKDEESTCIDNNGQHTGACMINQKGALHSPRQDQKLQEPIINGSPHSSNKRINKLADTDQESNNLFVNSTSDNPSTTSVNIETKIAVELEHTVIKNSVSSTSDDHDHKQHQNKQCHKNQKQCQNGHGGLREQMGENNVNEIVEYAEVEPRQVTNDTSANGKSEYTKCTIKVNRWMIDSSKESADIEELGHEMMHNIVCIIENHKAEQS